MYFFPQKTIFFINQNSHTNMIKLIAFGQILTFRFNYQTKIKKTVLQCYNKNQRMAGS